MKAVGIDLGTTYSAIATLDENGKPYIIRNKDNENLIPSVICFEENNLTVGTQAKYKQEQGEENIASFFKREMGNKNYVIDFYGKTYTPEDFSMIVLKELKKIAEEALKEEVKDAVITVPAYFENNMRIATRRAGERAGFNVIEIINEPTAAAVAYGIELDKDKGKSILVYDLGGGTFDVTVMTINQDGMEVLGTQGDHNLGGKDWDNEILNYVLNEFLEEFGVDPTEDSELRNDLIVETEQAKKHLTARRQVEISIAYQDKRGKYVLTRELFETLTRYLMEKTQVIVDQILAETGVSYQELDGVLLVGGSTRMPMVEEWVKSISGKEPLRGINPDEVVACGAALKCALESERNRLRLGGKKRDTFTLPSINIQDVIGHSLGMLSKNKDETAYINSRIVLKNSKIPAAEKKEYDLRTRAEKDNKLEVYILQGESDNPWDCVVDSKYVFSKIEHMEGKKAEIEVEYRYNKEGIIEVQARQNGQELPSRREDVEADISWMSQSPKDVERKFMPKNVLIGIDVSASMRGAPLEAAKKAAKGFIDEMEKHSEDFQIGIATFSITAGCIVHLTDDREKLISGINGIEIDKGEGNLHSYKIFDTALKEYLQRSDERNYIIILTDGVWNIQSRAEKRAESCKEKNIEIIAIGFGEADEAFLKKIATMEDQGIYTEDYSSLETTFKNQAIAISKEL